MISTNIVVAHSDKGAGQTGSRISIYICFDESGQFLLSKVLHWIVVPRSIKRLAPQVSRICKRCRYCESASRQPTLSLREHMPWCSSKRLSSALQSPSYRPQTPVQPGLCTLPCTQESDFRRVLCNLVGRKSHMQYCRTAWLEACIASFGWDLCITMILCDMLLQYCKPQ